MSSGARGARRAAAVFLAVMAMSVGAGAADDRIVVNPQAPYPEQVFFHRPHVNSAGMAQGALVNRALNFGAYVRYRAAELPHLWQWKMMGAGALRATVASST